MTTKYRHTDMRNTHTHERNMNRDLYRENSKTDTEQYSIMRIDRYRDRTSNVQRERAQKTRKRQQKRHRDTQY